MNVTLEWSTTFLAIAAHEGAILPNVYNVNLAFVTQTNDNREQNVAFERMKFMFREMFSDGIFVSSSSPLLEPLFQLAPGKMVVLPDEAFDQIIAMAILCKINAVMEGKIVLEEVKLSSIAGDNVWYSFDIEDDLGMFAAVPTKNKKFNKGKPWWHRSDIMTFDAKGKFDIADWSEVGLTWEEPAEETEIEFEADASLVEGVIDSKVKTKVIDFSAKKLYTGFTPELIDGGKTKIDED